MLENNAQQNEKLTVDDNIKGQNQENEKKNDDVNSVGSKGSNYSNISQGNDTQKLGDEVKFALTFFGRIVITLYSFHGLFFIYNFIVQYIIVFPGILYSIGNLPGQICVSLIYFFFALLVSNILVIPTYDFLLFQFLNFKNPLYHLESFSRIVNIIENKLDKEKDEDLNGFNKNVKWINWVLIIIEIFYLVGFIANLCSITIFIEDLTKLIVLFIIYLYYILIMFGYIMTSFYLIIKIIIFSVNKEGGCCKGFFKGILNIITNPFFFDSFFGQVNKNNQPLGPLPSINLFSYVFHPILIKSYDTKDVENKEKFNKVGGQIKWILLKNWVRVILFLIINILGLCYVHSDIWSKILLFISFVALMSISTVLNFPVLFRNKKTFGYYLSGKIKYKKEYKMLHPKMISFLRVITKVIIIIAVLILIGAFFFFSDSNRLNDINKKAEDLKPQNQTVDRHSLLLPSICFSSIHNIPLYLYLPFINDAYYYQKQSEEEEKPYFESSLQIKKYKELFFDDTYTIEVRSLVGPKDGQDSVKMVQYNVKNSVNEVTILSIKGTSNKKDVYMDFQLYFPSILLNLLSTFSILGQQKESLSFRFIEYSLSIPYRFFSQYSVINGYLEDLKSAYYKNNASFYKNIIITGHSLGGGLSKLLGRILNKQAVSLSGPGVNAFHSLWGYEGFSENFEISAIDLVPDLDLVPRVEVSGGTVYRIICNKGPFSCHGKELSLCEVLIMCRNPNYKTYCKTYAGLSDKDIQKLVESSDLNYDSL